MFQAIGIVIVIWYLSHVFTQSFSAFDYAGKAVFEVVETAAIVSQDKLKWIKGPSTPLGLYS